MRTRSEYRADVDGSSMPPPPSADRSIRPALETDRAALASVLLDAYRGTVDDEGETIDDAIDVVDDYLRRCLRGHSFVVEMGGSVLAFSFVVVVDRLHYIDPVATAADYKRHGLGRTVVSTCVSSLAEANISEVGAVITDGNVPSQNLFASLGFRRVGAWGIGSPP